MTLSQDFNYAIGKRIRRARSNRDYYQITLAEKIGITASHLSRIESGRRSLSAYQYCQIAIALNINESDLNPFRLLKNHELIFPSFDRLS